jgi:streptomycin 6-kinase
VDQWSSGLKKLRQRFAGETGPFPKRLVEMAERLFDELLSSSSSCVLLHGDLHHLNVLKSQDGWKAIDPKGVAGEPAYEVCALLLNPISRHSNDGQIQRRRGKRPALWSALSSASFTQGEMLGQAHSSVKLPCACATV